MWRTTLRIRNSSKGFQHWQNWVNCGGGEGAGSAELDCAKSDK